MSCASGQPGIPGNAPPGSPRTKEPVYPSTFGSGPISSDTVEKYRTIAVFKFTDAPGAPTSGAVASGILASQLNIKGFTVVERSRLEQIFSEPKLQLMSSDENANALKVGKIAGAQAVMVGEVGRWDSERLNIEGQSSYETYVTITVRMVDAESGTVLFSGDGHFSKPATTTPENAAWFILRAITTRLAVKAGLMSTGYTGFSWDLQKRSGVSSAVVTEFDPNSPARNAGLRSGDIILACNGTSSDSWKTQWQVMRACQVEAGHVLSLQILRGRQRITINMLAENRFK